MGQYYFVNENGENNKYPIKYNFGLTWMKSMERLD